MLTRPFRTFGINLVPSVPFVCPLCEEMPVTLENSEVGSAQLRDRSKSDSSIQVPPVNVIFLLIIRGENG